MYMCARVRMCACAYIYMYAHVCRALSRLCSVFFYMRWLDYYYYFVVVVVQGEVKEAKGGENIEGDWPGSHSAGALRRVSFARTIRPLKRTKSTLGTP